MRLEINNITKTFGRTVALDKVSFVLEEPGIHGFVGSNGAGKTTLLRILAGLDEPDSGDAAIDGVSRIEYPEKFRRRIGFMPDTLPNSRSIIVKEYIDFYASAFGLAGEAKPAKIKAVCEEKNLDYKSLTAKQKTELIKPFIVKETEEIILNCRLVPQSIIESDEDVLCSEVKVKNDNGEEEALEYNVTKYIDQFNKRVVTLLVCFSPEIRGEILIDNPDDRKSFTQKQAQLVSGFPNKESDQDTYEALMTPERKEIEFWLKAGEEPPFVKECGIDWDGLVQKHLEVLKKEEDALFKQEDKRYLEALEQITEEDLEKLENEGILPEVLNDIVVLDNTLHFKFVKLPDMSPSTGGYLFEDVCHMDISEEEYERLMSEEFAIDS